MLIGPLPPPLGGETVSTSKLVSSRYWASAGIRLDVINLYGSSGFRLQGDPIRLRDYLRGIRVFIQFLLRLRGKDRVLLLITRRSLCSLGLAVILTCRLARKPVVVKVFGSYVASQILEYRPAYRRLIVSTLSRTARILPQTRATARKLVKELGLDERLVTVFPNFLLDRSYTERRTPGPFSGRCLFIGHIKEEKGVFEIIEALGSRQGMSCDFYGESIPRYQETFLEAMAPHENLRFMGTIDHSSVIDIMKEHDVLLLPTRHIGEGMPAVILEAFSAGLPVIASDWKSIPDIVEDGVTGLLVPPADPKALREAVERLGGDRSLLESIVSKGYVTARTYSEKAVVNDLLIEDILCLCQPETRTERQDH